jgi:hypothetical protein
MLHKNGEIGEPMRKPTRAKAHSKSKFFALFCLVFAGFSCTVMKMGSLFLSGTLEANHFLSEIPLEFRRGLILVPVQINSGEKTYRFILDTGASFNVISTAVAWELNIIPRAADTMVDATQAKEKIKFAKVDRIIIGKIPFYGTAAAIFDLDRSAWLRCYEADGVIGMNLMRLVRCWHIDYAGKKVTFTNQEEGLPRSDSDITIPFSQDIQRIPKIRLDWRGLSLPFIVDLGSANGWMAPQTYWEKIVSRQKDIPHVRGYGEGSGGALGVEKNLQGLTGILRAPQCGEYRPPSLLLSIYQETFASVGNEFFCLFSVTFDWRKNEMRLTPQMSLTAPVLETFGFGFSYSEEGKCLYINYLYENSPAEAAGLKIGDRLLQVNDLDLNARSMEDYCRFFLNPRAIYGEADTLLLEVQRQGKTMTYTLKKKILLQ